MLTSPSWRFRTVDWFRRAPTTTIWWIGWLGIALKAGVISAGLVVLSMIPVEETVAMNAQLSEQASGRMIMQWSGGGDLPKSLFRGQAIRVSMGNGMSPAHTNIATIFALIRRGTCTSAGTTWAFPKESSAILTDRSSTPRIPERPIPNGDSGIRSPRPFAGLASRCPCAWVSVSTMLSSWARMTKGDASDGGLPFGRTAWISLRQF